MQPALLPRIPSGSATLSMNMNQEYSQPDQMLREHYMPPPTDHMDAVQQHQHTPPSPSNDPPSGEGNGGDSDEGIGADGRKGYGKRELSTSKRAAQNRAAQRAFRQRKEGYIKKLEEQVRDYQILSDNFKAVQAENYQLRDYIINLQSRLLESQGEVPPPPSNVDGLQPGKAGQHGPPGTLPRLSEMGAVGSGQQDGMTGIHDIQRSSYPDPSYPEPPSSKRSRTGEMTPSQAALQGASILSGAAAPR